MRALDQRLTVAALGLAALAGVWAATLARPGHGLARGTGTVAIVLLLLALASSPAAPWLAPARAVALRVGRRRVGIAAALVALGHACIALSSYVSPLVLSPIAAVPWLRHGALALGILAALLLTSFAAVQRALRVRAWSALHRLVYAAAILASLHALGVPFGSGLPGAAALLVTALSLLARPASRLARRRRPPAAPETGADG